MCDGVRYVFSFITFIALSKGLCAYTYYFKKSYNKCFYTYQLAIKYLELVTELMYLCLNKQVIEQSIKQELY